MPRSVNSVAAKARRKKYKTSQRLLRKKKNVHTVAKNAVEKGLQYAYRDRRQKEKLSTLDTAN